MPRRARRHSSWKARAGGWAAATRRCSGSPTGPLTAPVVGPLTAPVVGPLTAPAVGPLTAPVVGPLMAPAVGPLTAPAVGPLTAPGGAPDRPGSSGQRATRDSLGLSGHGPTPPARGGCAGGSPSRHRLGHRPRRERRPGGPTARGGRHWRIGGRGRSAGEPGGRAPGLAP